MGYKYVKLKEVCTVNQGLQIPISKRFKEKGKNRYFYITIQFLKGNTEEYYIENPKESVICKKEDILVVRTGSTGLVLTNVEGCFHNNFFKVVPNNKIYNKYLYYCLNNEKMYKEMLNVASGTTIPDLKHSSFYNLEIPLPNYDKQIKIAKIIEDIDKKININTHINDNLHEIVNLIYKEMFGEKKETEFDSLKNHADCILGGTPSRNKDEYWNGNINWINSGEVNKFRILEPSEKITELGLKKSSTVLLPQNTTVLAITGATLGQVSRLEIESCANQSVVGVVAKKDLTNNYIYLTILNHIDDIIKNQTGGAQQHINKGNVENFKLYIPTKNELEEFELKVNSIFENISLNCKENLVLQNIRDTLLPKLMNGEIDLDKIES